MKVLVTGATGFIGNHVIEELLKYNKYEIIASSRNESKARKFGWFKDVNYISQNLNKIRGNYFTFFGNPDLLIHLAWEGLPNFMELHHIKRNVFTNYYFIRNMIENGLQNLNVIGTCLEYGLQNGCLQEDLITNPIIPYAMGKDILRKLIENLNKKYNFYFKWIRLFYMYGEGQSAISILSQLDMALDNNEQIFKMSGGEQLRDYLPVEKVAEYIVKISLQNKINGIINCCSGKPITIRKLVENHLKKRNKIIKLNLGYYPYPDYEPMYFSGDYTKLKKIIKESE